MRAALAAFSLAVGLSLSACGPDLVEMRIRGLVSDATTGVPIPGAAVLLTWERGAVDLDAIGTATGPDGRYTLFVSRFPCDAPAVSAGGGEGDYEPRTRDISCSDSDQEVDFELRR